jgi:small subunit ribosomal protein S1
MTENFKELFEASLKQTEMRIGKIIKATVVAIDREFVWVDAGLKSESIITLDHFKDENGEIEIAVGDQVDVVLDALDNSLGETRLSREKAKRIELWTALEKAHEDNETVLGRITNHVRGGYTVEVRGLRAFLPGSLVDVRPLRDVSHLEGKDIELKIVKLDSKRNNIVVSRRAIIEAETQQDREALFEKLTEGAVVKGVVKNITDFGAFIDLGGIDGLLHITDMSWSRIKHPTDVLALGDEIDVKIIKFDSEKGRVSLGIKQLGEDPWVNVTKELVIGTKITGKVTNITDYGCFVKVREGIEGLVHTSEMDWSHKNANPHKLVVLGQEIEVMVLEVDASRHRISLGMKQCCLNPWQAFADQYKAGDKVTGKVRSITDFGIFVGLEGNIDGLVHISDVAWNNPEELLKQFKKGEDVEAVMLSIDIERERIALGIKQLADDPFAQFCNAHEKGSKVKGRVINVQQNGATIELGPEVTGFLHVADISHQHTKDANDELKVDQEIEACISNIDVKRRSINLSIKALDAEAVDPEQARYDVEQMTPTTIGDLIKEKLNKE